MLKIDHVSKIYHVGTFGGKELHAVSDISFDVGSGEIVALIGESGSGKSTIGKMVLGLSSISAGSISFMDADIKHLLKESAKSYYRHVQGVFQDPFSSYNPIFKADRIFQLVREEFFTTMKNSEWQEKLDGALCAVGLNPEQVLNKFPHQLSGGQLQRLLIARALLLDINFLVADEVISMLDASTRIDVLNLLGDLRANGHSILFITHDLSLGYYISDRAVILYRGCMAESGDTRKIFDEPMHPYTKMLMDSVPRMDRKWADEAVPVMVESRLTQFGTVRGCTYFGRCPIAKKGVCDVERPPLLEVEPGHLVACSQLETHSN